jgi:hypothetical protein
MDAVFGKPDGLRQKRAGQGRAIQDDFCILEHITLHRTLSIRKPSSILNFVHWTRLLFTVLHFTLLHSTPLHSTQLHHHSFSFPFHSCYFTSFNVTSLPFPSLPFHFISFLFLFMNIPYPLLQSHLSEA